MPTRLEARDVSHRFGSVLALDAVSVVVQAGTATAIVGESGSGKSTLLRAFNAMVVPERGMVSVGGVPVADQDVIALRRRLGYVQQHGGLIPHWTVITNVALVPRLLGRVDPAAISRALALVGLDEATFGQRLPHTLSGGQAQRVALARALVAAPEAILLDEPFGALDAISRADVQEAFLTLRRAIGITTLLVTHDLGEAARLSDRIVVMRGGRVEQEGTIGELRENPATPYVRRLTEQAAAAAAALTS